jgi:hypothetical protein
LEETEARFAIGAVRKSQICLARVYEPAAKSRCAAHSVLAVTKLGHADAADSMDRVARSSFVAGVTAAPPAQPELVVDVSIRRAARTSFKAAIRGRLLDGATAIWFDCEHLSATITGVQPDPDASAGSGAGRKRRKALRRRLSCYRWT